MDSSRFDLLNMIHDKEFYESWKCPSPSCGSSLEWLNLVDDTNGYEEGKIELKIKNNEVVCVCPCCGKSHIAEDTVYEIPQDEHRVEGWWNKDKEEGID